MNYFLVAIILVGIQPLLRAQILSENQSGPQTSSKHPPLLKRIGNPDSTRYNWVGSNAIHLQKIPRIPAAFHPGVHSYLPDENDLKGYWGIIAEALELPAANQKNQKTIIDVPPGYRPLQTFIPTEYGVNYPGTTRSAHRVEGKAQDYDRDLSRPKRKLRSKSFKTWPRIKNKGWSATPNAVDPSFIPLRSHGHDKHDNYIYYTSQAGPSEGVMDHHLAIVEVPKGARGRIPLNTVHVIAPKTPSLTEQSENESFDTFRPSAKAPLLNPPYMVKEEGEDAKDPILVIPFSERDARKHGVENVILPLQEAPSLIDDLNESFNQIRSASASAQSYQAPAPAPTPDPVIGFGPPKNEDVVLKGALTTGPRELYGNSPSDAREVSDYSTNLEQNYKNGNNNYGPPKTHSIISTVMQPPPDNTITNVPYTKPPPNYMNAIQNPIFYPPPHSFPSLESPKKKRKWPRLTTPSPGVDTAPTPPPGVQLFRSETLKFPPVRKGRRQFPFNILKESRKQFSKGLQETQEFFDDVFLGSESKQYHSFAKRPFIPKTSPLRQPKYNGRRKRVKGKQRKKIPSFHSTNSASRPLQNEHSVFFSKFPIYKAPVKKNQKGPNYKLSTPLLRSSSIKQLQPLASQNLAVRNPAISKPLPNYVRDDAQVPAKDSSVFHSVPVFMDTQQYVPPPSHRGLPAVDQNSSGGGNHLSVTNTENIKPHYKSSSNEILRIHQQTNPRKVGTKGKEQQNSPQLVMFTLEDAIPLVPRYEKSIKLKNLGSYPSGNQVQTSNIKNYNRGTVPKTSEHKNSLNKYIFLASRRKNSTAKTVGDIYPQGQMYPEATYNQEYFWSQTGDSTVEESQMPAPFLEKPTAAITEATLELQSVEHNTLRTPSEFNFQKVSLEDTKNFGSQNIAHTSNTFLQPNKYPSFFSSNHAAVESKRQTNTNNFNVFQKQKPVFEQIKAPKLRANTPRTNHLTSTRQSRPQNSKSVRNQSRQQWSASPSIEKGIVSEIKLDNGPISTAESIKDIQKHLGLSTTIATTKPIYFTANQHYNTQSTTQLPPFQPFQKVSLPNTKINTNSRPSQPRFKQNAKTTNSQELKFNQQRNVKFIQSQQPENKHNPKNLNPHILVNVQSTINHPQKEINPTNLNTEFPFTKNSQNSNTQTQSKINHQEQNKPNFIRPQQLLTQNMHNSNTQTQSKINHQQQNKPNFVRPQQLLTQNMHNSNTQTQSKIDHQKQQNKPNFVRPQHLLTQNLHNSNTQTKTKVNQQQQFKPNFVRQQQTSFTKNPITQSRSKPNPKQQPDNTNIVPVVQFGLKNTQVQPPQAQPQLRNSGSRRANSSRQNNKKENNNNQRVRIGDFNPFGAKFQKPEGNVRPLKRQPRKKQRIHSMELSDKHANNWARANDQYQDQTIQSNVKEDFLRIKPKKIEQDPDLLGSYSEQKNTVAKWPRFVRPQLKSTNNPEVVNRIKNSVNDIIVKNILEGTDIKKKGTQKSNVVSEEILNTEVGMSTLTENPRPKMSRRPQSILPFQKFRDLITNRKRILNSKMKQIQRNTDDKTATTETIHTTETTQSSTTPSPTTELPQTTNPTSQQPTTFKLTGYDSKRPKPMDIFAVLRQRMRQRTRTNPKQPNMNKMQTTTMQPLTIPPTTKIKTIETQTQPIKSSKLSDKRPSEKFSSKRVRSVKPLAESRKEDNVLSDQMTSKSQLRERRQPIQSVLLQDKKPKSFFNWKQEDQRQQTRIEKENGINTQMKGTTLIPASDLTRTKNENLISTRENGSSARISNRLKSPSTLTWKEKSRFKDSLSIPMTGILQTVNDPLASSYQESSNTIQYSQNYPSVNIASDSSSFIN